MNKIVFIFGVLIALMPFLGFPRAWKTVFFVAAGLFLAITAIFRTGAKKSKKQINEAGIPSFEHQSIDEIQDKEESDNI